MPALRYFLIAITSLSLAAVAFAGIVEGRGMSALEVLILLSIGAGLFANFMYLLGVNPSGHPTRPLSLFRLWIAAKESELKRRASSEG